MNRPVLIKNPKRRGEWAEAQFMMEATGQGLAVGKPWGDSARYDVVVENESGFLRVQVKSTLCRSKRSYACSVHPNQQGRPYGKRDFDFVAAYVIPVDAWYIIPAEMVIKGNMGMIILSPGIPGHKYEPYLEAWHLLREAKVGAGRGAR
jgi:hypothetical protein